MDINQRPGIASSWSCSAKLNIHNIASFTRTVYTHSGSLPKYKFAARTLNRRRIRITNVVVCVGGTLPSSNPVHFFLAADSSPRWQRSRAALSPTLPLATPVKFSLQLGGGNRGRAEACGDPYHTAVNTTTSTSTPDVLYHPLEMSQLTQACAGSLRQLP